MHVFHCEMKGIQMFAVNLLDYIAIKYYWHWSTSDFVMWKQKGWSFL